MYIFLVNTIPEFGHVTLWRYWSRDQSFQILKNASKSYVLYTVGKKWAQNQLYISFRAKVMPILVITQSDLLKTKKLEISPIIKLLMLLYRYVKWHHISSDTEIKRTNLKLGSFYFGALCFTYSHIQKNFTEKLLLHNLRWKKLSDVRVHFYLIINLLFSALLRNFLSVYIFNRIYGLRTRNPR